MRFYLASSLDNIFNARKITDYLIWKGWVCTYEWMTHGPIESIRELPQASKQELDGVRSADVVFILLPGHRGTHTELGCALGTGKPVIILAPSQELFFQETRPCSFYFHPSVVDRIIDDDIYNLACKAHRRGAKLRYRCHTDISCCEQIRAGDGASLDEDIIRFLQGIEAYCGPYAGGCLVFADQGEVYSEAVRLMGKYSIGSL